jgi:hypothetical protein
MVVPLWTGYLYTNYSDSVHSSLQANCCVFNNNPSEIRLNLPRANLETDSEIFNVIFGSDVTPDQVKKIKQIHEVNTKRFSALSIFCFKENMLYQEATIDSTKCASMTNVDDHFTLLHDICSATAAETFAPTEEDYSNEDIPDIDISSTKIGVRGMTNYGNTCFANAVFQSMSSSFQILAYALKLKQSLVDDIDTSHPQVQIVQEFFKVMQALNQTSHFETTPVQIATLLPLFPSDMKDRTKCHDAHEFLLFVRNQLNDVRLQLSTEHFTIANPFTGVYREHFTCLQCKNVITHQNENFDDLFIAISENDEEKKDNLTYNLQGTLFKNIIF